MRTVVHASGETPSKHLSAPYTRQPDVSSRFPHRAESSKNRPRLSSNTLASVDRTQSRQRPTLPRTYARSTIGGGRLNFRVRNGNGCDPAPMTTGKLAAWGPAGAERSSQPRRIAPADRPRLSRRQLNTLQTVAPISHTRQVQKDPPPVLS